MASIVYTLGENLYINLTNRCPCACNFCIRKGGDSIGSADSLWLDKGEPEAEDIVNELENWELEKYGEIVFCGYGEPLCALDVLLNTCKFIRRKGNFTLRLNTNGLGDLINKTHTAPLLDGLIDIVSVSLNAPDEQSYVDLCRPIYGGRAFDALINFAIECRQYVPSVTFSVVDVILPEQIEKCRELAEKSGIPLRVRNFS